MKSAEQSIGTSKRSRGDASFAAPASGDQPTTKEVHVDPTAAMDPTSDDDVANPIVAPPLSLYAMESFMTTQTAHRQLLNELLTDVTSLRANFVEYRSAFLPPPPSDP